MKKRTELAVAINPFFRVRLWDLRTTKKPLLQCNNGLVALQDGLEPTTP